VSEQPDQLLSAVLEIRELIRLMAEPAIAQRDEKPRAALRQIVGKSAVKSRVILLMDGSRTQSEIRQTVKIDAGDLSRLVKALRSAELLSNDEKPKLSIFLPPKFFEEKVDQ
jgi:hypothetical protein